MARTSADLVQMFAERRKLEWGPTFGSAWAQRNGTEAATFWVTKKQADWLISVYHQEFNIPTYNRHDGVGGQDDKVIVGTEEVAWKMYIAPNGCGQITLVK